MTYEEVVEYFGSSYKAAKSLGMCRNTPKNWRKWGYIPIEAQIRIEIYTNGELTADYSEIKERKGYRSNDG